MFSDENSIFFDTMIDAVAGEKLMPQLNCSDNALKPQNIEEMKIYMDGSKSRKNEVVLNRLQMKNNIAENIEYYR